MTRVSITPVRHPHAKGKLALITLVNVLLLGLSALAADTVQNGLEAKVASATDASVAGIVPLAIAPCRGSVSAG